MARKIPTDDYPTLSNIPLGVPVNIRYDGVLKHTATDANAAFLWLLRSGHFSVSYALKYGGWTCEAITN